MKRGAASRATSTATRMIVAAGRGGAAAVTVTAAPTVRDGDRLRKVRSGAEAHQHNSERRLQCRSGAHRRGYKVARPGVVVQGEGVTSALWKMNLGPSLGRSWGLPHTPANKKVNRLLKRRRKHRARATIGTHKTVCFHIEVFFTFHFCQASRRARSVLGELW